MTRALSLFILAGEPSGDRLGADLVARLRSRVALNLAGVGGDELIAAGLVPLYPMADLAVMGVTDVVARLPLLLWRVRQTVRAILAGRYDVAVLIDAQDFSRLVAQGLRRAGFAGRLVLYCAPTVWARKPERAVKLRPLFDAVLAILPFEPAVMARLGGPPTAYVGHPALADADLDHGLVERGPVLLLPGSRGGELRRHLPLLGSAAAALAGDPRVTGFVVPTLTHLRARLEAETWAWPVPVEIVVDRDTRRARYRASVLALCVAGTATLELALAGAPMVGVYVMDGYQARAFERLGRPLVTLPNIVLGRPAVPELVRGAAAPQELVSVAGALLADAGARARQRADFAEMTRLMVEGQAEAPREDPADRILALVASPQRPEIGA